MRPFKEMPRQAQVYDLAHGEKGVQSVIDSLVQGCSLQLRAAS